MDSVEVRRGTYHDSVRLMQASRALQQAQGVEEALVAMATDLNRELLAGTGTPVVHIPNGRVSILQRSAKQGPTTSSWPSGRLTTRPLLMPGTPSRRR